MKKLLLMAAVMVAGFAASAQDIKATDVVSLSADSHNFGKIKQGVPVTTYFELKNTSERPIVIESAVAGCGCTTPEYSKEPIAPNSVAKLKVGYNAAAAGPFTKDVTVKLAGIQQPMILRITGEVVVDNGNITSANNVPPPPPPTVAKPVVSPKSQVKNKPATTKKTSGKK
jgi:hypothetical protein